MWLHTSVQASGPSFVFKLLYFYFIKKRQFSVWQKIIPFTVCASQRKVPFYVPFENELPVFYKLKPDLDWGPCRFITWQKCQLMPCKRVVWDHLRSWFYIDLQKCWAEIHFNGTYWTSWDLQIFSRMEHVFSDLSELFQNIVCLHSHKCYLF